jgi:hypothetical protein
VVEDHQTLPEEAEEEDGEVEFNSNKLAKIVASKVTIRRAAVRRRKKMQA